MKVLCSQESESAYEACVTEHALNVSALWEEVVKASWDKTDMLYLRYKHQMKTWEKYVTVSSSVFENTVRKMFESSCRLVLKRYGITEKAYEAFLEHAKKCDPPLPESELKDYLEQCSEVL